MNPVDVTVRHRQAATDWFARLNDDAAPDSDWVAFRDWLEAEPANRLAYDAVEALWVDLDEFAADPVIKLAERRRVRMPAWSVWAVGAAASAAVAAVVLGPRFISPEAQVYATQTGETRVVTLPDGSKIALNSASRLHVRFHGAHRDVVLDEGEAAFDIVHDPARPFSLAAGDQQIRVLGTAFDVLRHNAALTVTVQRGLVSVAPGTGDQSTKVLLPAGKQLIRHPGAPVAVSDVDSSESIAWRTGRLIYRDRPLSEVAEDLSRYLRIPLTVDPSIAALKVTAVLKIDDEEAMVDRLQSFLPIKAETTAKEVRLRAGPARR